MSCNAGIIMAPAFFDDQDRHAYLNWLGEALQRKQCSLHAFVPMANHAHLLVTPERAASIPRLIIAIARRYVRYMNHTYGESDPILTQHPLYLALGADPIQRQAAYRDLFPFSLEGAPVADLRMALNQHQPIGNVRFYVQIVAMTGQRRALKKRGRPRKTRVEPMPGEPGQQELSL